MVGRRDILRSLAAVCLSGRRLFSDEPVPTPFLQNVTPTGATLVWPPGSPAPAPVEWSCGGGLWRASAAAARECGGVAALTAGQPDQFSAQLSGLSPAASVSYRLASDPGRAWRFRTPATTPEPFTFLAFGDSGAGTEEQFTLGRWMAAEACDLAVHTGDVVYPVPTPEGIQSRYLDCYRDFMADRPLYISLGNHDYSADYGFPLLRIHAFPPVEGLAPAEAGRYYSFQWNRAHFIALDSNTLSDQAMLAWLDRELERPAFWRVVYFHHPPYSNGVHAEDPACLEAARTLAPRLERAGVPLVLCGHDHNYQRFAPIGRTVYCITGGGGGGLYPVGAHSQHAFAASVHHYMRARIDGWQMKLAAIGLDGQAFDTAVIAPQPVLSDGGPVNPADLEPRLAPGGLASIQGAQLALSGPGDAAEVTVGGQPARVVDAGPGMLSIVLPDMAPGQAEVVARTPNGTARTMIALLESAPALFRDNAGFALTDRPAQAGGAIVLYATGLGRGVVDAECGGKAVPVTVSPSLDLPGVQSIALELPAGMAGVVTLRLRAGSAWSKPARLKIG
jgi:uncharacterized protein (TIGR03437 family)